MQELAKINHDGTKNAVIIASGVDAPFGVHRLIDFASLAHSPKKVRIDSITYSLAGPIALWWLVGDKQLAFIMPLEGRGFLNFEGYQSLNPPEGATGIGIGFEKQFGYFLLLDLVKQ